MRCNVGNRFYSSNSVYFYPEYALFNTGGWDIIIKFDKGFPIKCWVRWVRWVRNIKYVSTDVKRNWVEESINIVEHFNLEQNHVRDLTEEEAFLELL